MLIFNSRDLLMRKTEISCSVLLGKKSAYFDKCEGYEVILVEKEGGKATWHICWVGSRESANMIERFWQKDIFRAVRKMKKQKYYCEKVFGKN